MSRTASILVDVAKERPVLARGLVCASLALDALCPRATVTMLMARFVEAKRPARGGRGLTPIRIADELEALGAIRILDWPTVEVLLEPTAEVFGEGFEFEWIDSVLRCAALMRKADA
jgi:hypothetical protein